VNNQSDKNQVVPFFNETRSALLGRFISILITAILSALISFLQSLSIEAPAPHQVEEQVVMAGVVGTILRSGLEFASIRHIIK